MPNLDRKGPNGEKAMSGRKLGKCNPANKGKTDEEILLARATEVPTGSSMGLGRGFGRGFGLGKGMGKGQGFGRGQCKTDTNK